MPNSQYGFPVTSAQLAFIVLPARGHRPFAGTAQTVLVNAFPIRRSCRNDTLSEDVVLGIKGCAALGTTG